MGYGSSGTPDTLKSQGQCSCGKAKPAKAGKKAAPKAAAKGKPKKAR